MNFPDLALRPIFAMTDLSFSLGLKGGANWNTFGVTKQPIGGPTRWRIFWDSPPLSVHRFYHTTISCVCKLLTTIGRAMGCPGSMNPADARCSIDWNSASKHRFQRRCRGDSSPSCGRHANLDPLSAMAKGSSVEAMDMRLFDLRTRGPSVRSAISATYDEPGHTHSGTRRSIACQEPGNFQTSVKSAIQRKRHSCLLLWPKSPTARIRLAASWRLHQGRERHRDHWCSQPPRRLPLKNQHGVI